MRPRIGISQRLMKIDNSEEEREGLDLQWSRFLWGLGYFPVPLSNYFGLSGAREYLMQSNLQGIILSGGDDIGDWPLRDDYEFKLLQFAHAKNIPLLGVCRGMQIINNFYGGTLEKVHGHVRTSHRISCKFGASMVNSYHNFAVRKSDLNENFEILAESDDGIIEAIAHKDQKMWGIMWHPERYAVTNRLDSDILQEIFS